MLPAHHPQHCAFLCKGLPHAAGSARVASYMSNAVRLCYDYTSYRLNWVVTIQDQMKDCYKLHRDMSGMCRLLSHYHAPN